MADKTSIEWTDYTFNPWWGCAKVSILCDHCYAETWAKRVGMDLWGVDAPRRTFGDKHWNEPLKWDTTAAKAGRHARVFCASMADVFDKNAPEGARDRLWQLIRDTPNLDWQLLTKRIGNALRMLPGDWGYGYENVWLGISVGNQEEADRDIPKLLGINARIRFLSCEPLLGPIYLGAYHLADRCGGEYPFPRLPTEHRTTRADMLDWVISGGESGSKARPTHPDWHRSLRDQCTAARVAYLFKQWGAWWPISQMPDGVSDGFYDPKYGARKRDKYDKRPPPRPVRTTVLQLDGQQEFAFLAGAMTCFKVGKKVAGRMLDGRTHDEYPT